MEYADFLKNKIRMAALNGLPCDQGEIHPALKPHQLDIVERLINRYSNKGDLVYDPFGGLMTAPYCAVRMGRRGGASELCEEYFRDGVNYLRQAEAEFCSPTLFDMEVA